MLDINQLPAAITEIAKGEPIGPSAKSKTTVLGESDLVELFRLGCREKTAIQTSSGMKRARTANVKIRGSSSMKAASATTLASGYKGETMSRRRVLVYKRTHNGDPDEYGVFGAHDCMGAVRNRDFDAVIGVGGVGNEPERLGIARKINWIGISPQKFITRGLKWPMVTFSHFLDFGAGGQVFKSRAPTLAERMYSNNVRAVMNSLSEQEYREAEGIIELANGAPPSTGWPNDRNPHRSVCDIRDDRAKAGRVTVYASWGIYKDLNLVEEFPYADRVGAEQRVRELLVKGSGYYLKTFKFTGG